jgi:predicted DNA-binding transcriptional regulator AlpA
LSRKEIVIGIGALLISISIVISGYLIGEAIKTVIAAEANNTTESVMDLPEAAKYLNMSEAEVRAIMRLEEEQITQYGFFSGMRFPHFTIDDKQYFYKDEIDEWLKEVASRHAIYDTNKGFILQ